MSLPQDSAQFVLNHYGTSESSTASVELAVLGDVARGDPAARHLVHRVPRRSHAVHAGARRAPVPRSRPPPRGTCTARTSRAGGQSSRPSIWRATATKRCIRPTGSPAWCDVWAPAGRNRRRGRGVRSRSTEARATLSPAGAVAPVFGADEGETGHAAGQRDPSGGDARQASTRKTGMPSSRALSTRFSVIPAPGKATRPVGRSFSIWSLRRNGAARPWAFQSGRNTT